MMSSLFRSINFTAKKENAIKEAIINALSENAREIQYEVEAGNCCLELCEITTSLCTALEAVFLHGIKESFLWQTMHFIADDNDSHRPEPSFWAPLLVFLHKQVIEQIQSLSQITSEIGQCRAWIRLSLNECLFSSYLNNMRKNSSALSPYYKKTALLKDRDGLEMAAKILGEIEAYAQFNLPVNSSLLNQWPDISLQLSGLWTPPLKSCPISSGVDIAGSLPADAMSIPTPQPLQTNELFSESISNSPFSRSSNFAVDDLSSRENLDIFLRKVDAMDIIDEEDIQEAKERELNAQSESHSTHIKGTKDKGKKKRKDPKILSTESKSKVATNDEATFSVPHDWAQSVHGNSLMNLMQTSWVGDENSDVNVSRQTSLNSQTPTNEDELHARFYHRSVSMTSSTNSLRSPLGDRCSYNALLKKHERNREVDWTEVWEKFLMQNTVNTIGGGDSVDQDTMEGDDSLTNSDFEVLQNSALDKFDIVELQEMVEQLCKLPRELGLDAQGFLCKSCQHPLGIGYSSFQVCAFSGSYYCNSCMDIEPVLIPSRLIYNWDFRKNFVSKRAAAFLSEFRSQPFIDLKILNPDIYNASDTMAELQSLRIRLNFIRAYLYTCGPSSIEELQRQFFGKEYLYDHIHQYSIGDLGLIQRGILNQQLQKAFKIGETHVLKCHLCSVKGFICEICQGSRVLYPFHIDTTYRCSTCGAVFHADCLNEQQPCPKCERIRKREEMPLIEAVQDLKDKLSKQCVEVQEENLATAAAN